MDVKNLIEIKKIFAKGEEFFKKGEFEKALKKWKETFLQFQEIGNSKGMAEILYHISIVQKKIGQFQEAIINLKQSLELYDFLNEDKKMATVLHSMALIFIDLGEIHVAQHHLEQALEIYKTLNEDVGIGAVLFEMGNIYLQKNELLKAREFFEKSLDIQRKIGDLIGIGKCYYSLSLLSLKEELLDESFRYLREAKSIFDDHGFLEGKLLVTMLEGLINLRQKRITKAESAFSKCKKLISEKYRAKPVKSNMADKKMNVQILINLGNLFLWDSNINLPEIGKTLNVKAYDYYNQAADLAREINDRNGECHATFQMGIILHERGGLDNIRSSNEKFTNALEIAKMINDDELILRCLLFLGVNHRLLKKYEDSITYLQDCLVLAKAREYPIFTIKALLEMFQVFFEIGRSDDALSALKEAENLAGNNAELKRYLGEIYYLYGSFYETMGDIGKANDFFLQSLKLSEKGKDIKSISKTFYQLAKLNENQGFITSALEYID
ncbi:MAG: tetratricopeptide repeat protein, partial [Promethearchaeota archaeon]